MARDAPAESLLESLPGVGPALARRIRSEYGSDEAFAAAVRSFDLDRLLAMEGLSERRAFEIAAAVASDGDAGLAASDRARDVRREVEEILCGYAQTAWGKRALRLLPVLRDGAAIAKRSSQVLAARDLAERLDRPAVARALAGLQRWKDAPRETVRRLVLAETEDDELRLRSAGLDRWCRVAHGPDAVRQADDFDVVVYASNEGDLPVEDLPNVVRASIADPLHRFVPEVELGFAHANRRTLESLAALARLLDRSSEAHRVLEALDAVGPARPVDARKAAAAALAAAEAELRARVATMSLAGDQILELIGRSMPAGIDEARRAASDAARASFRAATGLDADLLEAGLPLRLDEAEVDRLNAEAAGRSAVDRFVRAQAAARAIEASRAALRDELASWWRFDVEHALGCYALEHHAVAASTSSALRFEGARNLRLARIGGLQPVAYELGGESPVAVLTGANSGGKSSLLELAAQILLLHHWGLPVPAERAEVPIMDQLLLFGATRGTDAGALETFLRDLFPPIVGPGRKLVLLDEVESVTELEAAGRILGVFMDEVARSGSLCVLVTHLPEEVVRHATVPVRIDGIDAVGLDDKFNLIVDRQPKLGHRARSTPELVLRRVHARSQGRVREVFGRVLARWDTPRA